MDDPSGSFAAFFRASRPTIHSPPAAPEIRTCAATASSGRYRNDGSVVDSVTTDGESHCGIAKTSHGASSLQGHERERGVGGAEIDADGEAGSRLRNEYLACGVRTLFRADLELDLPAAIGVRMLHPKLKNAEFGDDGVDPHRHRLPGRELLDGG